MKLIDPGSGDFIDRFSILTLKIHHGTADTVEDFVTESGGIWRAVPWIDLRLELVMRITMVNTLMWVATDELDTAIATPMVSSAAERVGYIAKRLRKLNLQRAKLVGELSGIDKAIEEEEADV